jgi:PAS domain S-box-containing protein
MGVQGGTVHSRHCHGAAGLYRRVMLARESQRRSSPGIPDYQALFESAPGLFLVLDPHLTIVAVSDAYLAATMTSRAEILGRDIFDAFPDNPDDPNADGGADLRASLDRVRASLVADSMAIQKYDIRRPDDEGGGFEERFWSPMNSPVLTADGELASIIHRVEDVTEFVRLRNLGTERERAATELRSGSSEIEAEVYRRAHDIAESNRELQLANAELQRARAFLDSLIENIPDMVFVKDATTLKFLRHNRAGEEILGYTRAELVGKSDYDFFDKDMAEAFIAKDRLVLEGGRVVDIPEEPLDTPHHGRRILHTKKIPLFDESGAPAYLLGISEDITERKAAEDAVRQARTEAEQANLAKTEFLSRMSHELRTPLNAILGFSQLLDMDELTADQRQSVGYISQAGRHLLGLINEVLDISRIESGQLSISTEPVSVDDVLGEVLALIQQPAKERGISVTATAAVRGATVLADHQRLRQVVLNLLSNAVKYNREGGTIAVDCVAVASDGVRISVTDTGYGIAAADLERVFRPFDRIGAESGGVEGTGIGLALSKGLVVAMGGSIGVESVVDTGSTFWVELPGAEAPRVGEQQNERVAYPTIEIGQRLILQVEDNVSNLRLVEQIVARQPGVELITAIEGGLGVKLARERHPDLILLDLHLPDMSGAEVLRRLRTYDDTRTIPVVVLSADATERQITRLTAAGAFGYLTKPLDVAEFLRMVDQATTRPPRAA